MEDPIVILSTVSEKFGNDEELLKHPCVNHISAVLKDDETLEAIIAGNNLNILIATNQRLISIKTGAFDSTPREDASFYYHDIASFKADRGFLVLGFTLKTRDGKVKQFPGQKHQREQFAAVINARLQDNVIDSAQSDTPKPEPAPSVPELEQEPAAAQQDTRSGLGGWMARRAEEREQKRLAKLEAEEQKQRELEEFQQLLESILEMVGEGKVPDIDWPTFVGQLPFRFMKSEHLVWVFPVTRYMEQRTKREVVGRSAGASFRVAKGVYVRAGQSRGTPVESDEIVDRGIGMMAVTTKHIYFNGNRSFRINFNKIVSVDQYGADAVTITRDRASQQPEFFVVGSLHATFASELLWTIPSLELAPGQFEKETPPEQYLLPLDNTDYFFD